MMKTSSAAGCSCCLSSMDVVLVARRTNDLIQLNPVWGSIIRIICNNEILFSFRLCFCARSNCSLKVVRVPPYSHTPTMPQSQCKLFSSQ